MRCRTQKVKNQLLVKTRIGTFSLDISSKGLYAVRFPKRGQADFFTFHKKFSLSPLLREFCNRKLDLTGYTPFQKKIYQVLGKVPAGKVITYGELARRAGYPGAARAVGSAMKKNRLPIVIPCHRVIPASGPNTYQFSRSRNWGRPNYHFGKKIISLGGGLGEYSAGKKWKRWLLEYEKGPRSSGPGTRKKRGTKTSSE
ncbi:MAG: methylated-DNA--[protein]-cysteine S-methyltransferase [Candidatus Omnitrophota bacterium]